MSGPRWMSDPCTEDEFREHWQRFLKPDGLCLWCRKPAADGPCGTITIKISEEAIDNGEVFTHQFCSWECLAHRFADCAGGVFVHTDVNTAADLHNE